MKMASNTKKSSLSNSSSKPVYDYDDYDRNLDYSQPPPPYSEVCSVPIPTQISSVQAEYRSFIPASDKNEIIGCCTVETWTQVIAALQIFGSLSALVRFIVLAGYQASSESDSYYVSNPGAQLIHLSLGLIFGCVLLAGTQLRIPVLITVWLVSTGFSILVLLSITIFLLIAFLTGGGMPVLLVIVILTFVLTVQYFCFSVVKMHRQHIVSEKSQRGMRGGAILAM